MLFAAVILPIMIFYFYRITTRERTAFLQKWKAIGDINEQTTIQGSILKLSVRKERFYQEYYIRIIEIWVQTPKGEVKAIKKEPITEDLQPVPLTIKQELLLKGHWEDRRFNFGTYQAFTSAN